MARLTVKVLAGESETNFAAAIFFCPSTRKQMFEDKQTVVA
jgi:hypothetical protein